MFQGPSSLKAQLTAKLLEEAVESAKHGRYAVAAAMFGQSGVLPGERATDANDLAYAFYRRALTHQSNLDEVGAIRDLQTALQFPGLRRPLRSLIQQRMTVIQQEASAETRKLEAAIAGQFDRPPSSVELRAKFLERFGLSQPNRRPTVHGVDEISSIGVYRWAGDVNRNERWSRLIREFKEGDAVLAAFFGRLLAEHVRGNAMCNAWTRDVDYIVPVPPAASRRAERGMDIVVTAGEHLSSRLGIPSRTDFLRRKDHSERSRSVSKFELAGQYSFNERKAEEIEGRAVLLLDDVMTRGYTVGVCATRLREFGCARVVLLVLALAESSLQSGRHAGEGGS